MGRRGIGLIIAELLQNYCIEITLMLKPSKICTNLVCYLKNFNL